MDYRLLKIKEYSKDIDALRDKIRTSKIDNNLYKKIIDDLDILSEHLKGYGNSISITIILNGEQMTLEISAYEKDNVFKYRLFSKKDKTDKVKLFYTLAIDYNLESFSKFCKEVEKRKKEGLASWKDEYLPIPIHPQYKAFLIDNWEELYNDILNTVMAKLEKEKIHMEFELETINKYV